MPAGLLWGGNMCLACSCTMTTCFAGQTWQAPSGATLPKKKTSATPPPPSRGRTMNMDFHPDLTLATRASTIWLTQRMMSSRISSARLCRITTTNGRRKSFWSRGR